MSHYHSGRWVLDNKAKERIERLMLRELIVAPSTLSYGVNERLEDLLEVLDEGVILDGVKRKVYLPYTVTLLSDDEAEFLVRELWGLEYKPSAWERFKEVSGRYSWEYGRRLLSEIRKEELPSSLARFISFVAMRRREAEWRIEPWELFERSKELEEPWKFLSSSLEESVSGLPLGVRALYLETFLFTAMGSGALTSSIRTIRSIISKLRGSTIIRLGADFGTKFREYKEKLKIPWIVKVIGLASLLSAISGSPDVVDALLSSLQSPFREALYVSIALIELYDP